jgi:hypothetical protein
MLRQSSVLTAAEILPGWIGIGAFCAYIIGGLNDAHTGNF